MLPGLLYYGLRPLELSTSSQNGYQALTRFFLSAACTVDRLDLARQKAGFPLPAKATLELANPWSAFSSPKAFEAWTKGP